MQPNFGFPYGVISLEPTNIHVNSKKIRVRQEEWLVFRLPAGDVVHLKQNLAKMKTFVMDNKAEIRQTLANAAIAAAAAAA